MRKQANDTIQNLFILLVFTLLTCLWTLRDSFKCSGGTNQDCDDIRKNLSCKSKVVSPMWSQMTLTIGEGSSVQVSVFCGWETASS